MQVFFKTIWTCLANICKPPVGDDFRQRFIFVLLEQIGGGLENSVRNVAKPGLRPVKRQKVTGSHGSRVGNRKQPFRSVPQIYPCHIHVTSTSLSVMIYGLLYIHLSIPPSTNQPNGPNYLFVIGQNHVQSTVVSDVMWRFFETKHAFDL